MRLTGTSSDHYLITFVVPCNLLISKSKYKLVHTRNYQNIDLENLKRDILNSDLYDSNTLSSIETAVAAYNNELQRIIDLHAPVQKYYVKNNSQPWWNKECQDARRERRRAERCYRKNRTLETRLLYKHKCNKAASVIHSARECFFRNKLDMAKGDSKATYSIIDYLLGQRKSKTLPTGEDDEKTANDFSNYFQSKIEKIHSELLKETSLTSIFQNIRNSVLQYRS